MSADLGGDDIKVVSYRIVFTKPGCEAVLAQGEEVVSYPTTAPELTSRLVSDFLARLASEGMAWPPSWKHCLGEGYPAVGQPIRGIPDEDRTYLAARFEVISRIPRADDTLDQAQLDVLREVKDQLGL